MKTISFYVLVILLSFALCNCAKNDDELKGNSMNVTSIDPSSPATLEFNEFVIIEYEYNISNSEGARMWVIPYTDGSKSPGYLYSSSTVYTGNGGRQVGVSIDDSSEPVVVDQLQVIMKNPDQSETLYEEFINVNFTFE